MRSLTVLVAFLFAFVATSYASGIPVLEARKDRNATRSHGGDTTKMACKEMRKLTALTTLAGNQTKLDELVAKGKLDTAKVDALKKKAADATTKLQTLSSNTTLTSECAAIDAQGQMKSQCKQMKSLQKLAKLASNTTAMDAFAAKKNLNSTQVDGLKNKLQKADTKLKALEANTTLTDFCKQMKQGKESSGTDGEFVFTRSSDETTNNVSGTTSAGAAVGSNTPNQAATSGSSEVQASLKIMSYVFVPIVAGVFTMLL
jgi:hypothetical protein